MKRLLIPLLLTLLLASSLTAQTRVTLGPERIITTFSRPTLMVAGAEGNAPAFAAAGRDGHYLMAWSEYDDESKTRASLHTAAIDSTGAIIEGSRFVAPAVRSIDPNAQYPAVAFDGERFLVAWIEGSYMVTRVLAMRFDRDGKPLEPTPQLISLDARHTPIAVAAGGGEFTIAYSRWATVGTASAVSRVRADGTVLERDRNVPGTAGFWRDIESNGTEAFMVRDSSISTFGCVIMSCSPLTLRTFSRVGLATTTAAAPVTDQLFYLLAVGSGVATDGQRFLAVNWAPNLTPLGRSGSLIRGQLTDPTGASFVREFLVAKPSASFDLPGGRIDAVWTGGSYAIAYEERPSRLDINLTLVFVSQIGMALTDPVELAVSAQHERTPVILPLSGSRVLVLYERGDYERPEIVARQATLSLRTRAVR